MSLDDARLSGEINKAQKLVMETANWLETRKLNLEAEIVRRVFPIALPPLILSRKGNPVHHSPQVLQFMAEILVGEKAEGAGLKEGLIASLLHDTGAEGKIRRADIDAEQDTKRREELRSMAIQLRKDHMKMGADVAEYVILAFATFCPELAFSAKDIAAVRQVIETHDNPSVLEYVETKDTIWLLPKDEFLMMCHREADRLWMLSIEGLETDMDRDAKKKPELAKNPQAAARKRILGNIQRHKDEYKLYERFLLPNELREYGFKEETLYRTRTGIAVFRRLIKGAMGYFDLDLTNDIGALGIAL